MSNMLEKLLVLQDRDLKLARLQMEQSRVPIEQGVLDAQTKGALDEVELAKQDCKRQETDRKKLEVDVLAKQELVRKYKNQLLEIKNNDQFHALQHEITAAEGDIRKIEDVELEIMEKLERAQAALKQAEARAKEVNQQVQMQVQELKQKASAIEKQLGELQVERARLAGETEEDVLTRYEKISRSKQGQAIARVSHGLCTGCHLKLTAQEIHHAQHGQEMVTCTNCGRILYWMAE